MKTLQHFSEDYLDQCRKMTPLQIAKFLDGFLKMVAQTQEPVQKLKPICIKMSESLLAALKKRAKKEDKPYQTLLKEILMREVL